MARRTGDVRPTRPAQRFSTAKDQHTPRLSSPLLTALRHVPESIRRLFFPFDNRNRKLPPSLIANCAVHSDANAGVR